MRNAVKLILMLAAAVLLMFAVRSYVFTVYTVPTNSLNPGLSEGDRVIVNRLSHARINKNDAVVINSDDSTAVLGRVRALPGDTIQIKGNRYVIPSSCCCRICKCSNCKLYLIDVEGVMMLVCKNDIIGKPQRLYPFRK